MAGYTAVQEFLALPRGTEVSQETHFLFMSPDWYDQEVLHDPAFKEAGEAIRGEVSGWRIHADYANPVGTMHYGRCDGYCIGRH